MIYNIAGITIDMEPKFPRTAKQSEAYLAPDTVNADVRIRLDEAYMAQLLKENPQLSEESCEYICMGSEFYDALISYGGFLLHSSAVVYNEKAYLFSAPSGTGKSTHTQLWLKRFDGAYILNDDKPAIKIQKNGFFAFGTPFSGKTDLNINKCVPLGGICFIERSDKNYIEKIPSDEALFRLLNQTVRPYGQNKMDILLKILDKLINTMPIYKLHCNMDSEAADVAYNGMKGELK